jgi:hypothetical protein
MRREAAGRSEGRLVRPLFHPTPPTALAPGSATPWWVQLVFVRRWAGRHSFNVFNLNVATVVRRERYNPGPSRVLRSARTGGGRRGSSPFNVVVPLQCHCGGRRGSAPFNVTAGVEGGRPPSTSQPVTRPFRGSTIATSRMSEPETDPEMAGRWEENAPRDPPPSRQIRVGAAEGRGRPYTERPRHPNETGRGFEAGDAGSHPRTTRVSGPCAGWVDKSTSQPIQSRLTCRLVDLSTC